MSSFILFLRSVRIDVVRNLKAARNFECIFPMANSLYWTFKLYECVREKVFRYRDIVYGGRRRYISFFCSVSCEIYNGHIWARAFNRKCVTLLLRFTDADRNAINYSLFSMGLGMVGAWIPHDENIKSWKRMTRNCINPNTIPWLYVWVWKRERESFFLPVVWEPFLMLFIRRHNLCKQIIAFIFEIDL